MKTLDLFAFNKSSKKLNESLQKVFGKKINFETFDLTQLHDARNKLRTQLSQIREHSGFNENLESDAFHQAQWMLDAINAEIAERDEHIIEAEDDKEDIPAEVEAEIERFLETNPKNGDDLQAFHHKAISDRNKDLDDYLSELYDYVADQTGAGGTEELGVYDEMLDMLNQMMADKGWKDDRDIDEGAMKDVDYDLRMLAGEDEEELIAALQGEYGSGVADVLNDMMSELQDELASKGMNDVMNDDDKMIEMLWDKLVDEYGGDDEYNDDGDMDSSDADADALKSAGFGSDEDYESIQYEDRVDEKAVSKSQQQAAGIALAAKRKGKTPPGKGAAAQMAKMSTKELEKYAGTKHKGLPDKKDESVDQGEEMTRVTEGEIQQASAIVTAKTMVDRVGRWIEELSGMENDTLLQLGDSIRDEMGQEAAKNFISTVAPAIQQALENLKGARETLSTGVRALTGEEQPAEMLGAEPGAEGGEEDMTAPAPEAGAEMPAEEPAGDEFAAAEPAAGGPEAAGREQRESIERQNRLLKVLAG